ncbi:MAG: OmpA family protein [Taibaiella sp.]|nr:OmpA family protein [Taibaiella sp.]
MTSCIVSKKKYDAETARAEKEKAEKLALNKQLNDQVDVNKKLNAANLDLKNNITALNGRIARLKDSISTLEGTVKDLTNKVNVLGDEKENTKRQLNSTKEQIASQRQRLEQLQALLDQQQAAAEALRKKIAEALKGFNSNELTVKMKNGKVYISMQESLLFPSGSAVVNPKGKDALSKVAGVLNTSTEININIEGHTDSLPIHTAKFADNWELSTARATSIAHVLIDEYHVTPAKLVASGRSEYDPIAPNSTPEGRGQNRRTEIILEPKLDELMKLMEAK